MEDAALILVHPYFDEYEDLSVEYATELALTYFPGDTVLVKAAPHHEEAEAVPWNGVDAYDEVLVDEEGFGHVARDTVKDAALDAYATLYFGGGFLNTCFQNTVQDTVAYMESCPDPPEQRVFTDLVYVRDVAGPRMAYAAYRQPQRKQDQEITAQIDALFPEDDAVTQFMEQLPDCISA